MCGRRARQWTAQERGSGLQQGTALTCSGGRCRTLSGATGRSAGCGWGEGCRACGSGKVQGEV